MNYKDGVAWCKAKGKQVKALSVYSEFQTSVKAIETYKAGLVMLEFGSKANNPKAYYFLQN